MKRLLTLLLSAVSLSASALAQPVKDRIIYNDPAKYRKLSAVHAGAGQMGFTQLIGRTELSTNFLYLHSGAIDPGSGIGHHFHHNIEEMYVILNGEAEFTINGRTSVIRAPAIVPCKMGNAHAIYNAGTDTLRWLNYAVSLYKGRGDNFDLNDNRAEAAKDPIPVFVSGRLEKDKMKANNTAYTGDSIFYRRMLGPEIFSTNWNHVDDIIIPAGSSSRRLQDGIEEVYYVIKGNGTVAINNETASFKTNDAFYGKLGETLALTNDGNDELEILVIGIAASKNKLLTKTNPAIPKAVVLQMDFIVPEENAEKFEKMYTSVYVPAMTVQQGYLQSKLLRLYPENIARQIEAEPSTYNYQIQISFDTEENRMKWVKSKEHLIAWPAASGLATAYKWRGYDVLGDDYQE